MEQKTFGFCGNPKQTNQDLKSYTYYPFTCELHEKGVSESRLKYMEEEARKEYEQTQLFLKGCRLYQSSQLFTTPKEPN